MNIKSIFNIRAIIIVSALLFLILNHLIYILDGISAIYSFIGAFILFIILVTSTLIGIYRIIKLRKSNLVIPLVISLIVFFITYFHPIERIIESTKSPKVLFAYCEHSMYSVSIKFREDTSFEYYPGGIFTNKKYFGNYLIKNDTIILNFKNKNLNNVASKLLMTERYLTEIDSTKKYYHTFKITYNKMNP